MEFEKKKDFLVCVDSDGCAMDTMDCKHIQCFGPCMVEEWGLETWEQPILARWNEINLYTMTRGINRFKGLAMALSEINEACCRIEGVERFAEWTETARELSNDSVAKAAKTEHNPCFTKALSWSKKVNAAINALPDSTKKAYDGVLEGLQEAHRFADVAVVSSANKEAVEEEWERCGLLPHVDILCCQDMGSKAHCIAQLKALGYAPDHILMVGDAPGDKDAAEKNQVFYYPILVKRESQSWQELRDIGFAKLQGGTYADYELEKKRQFLLNLGAEEA